MIYRWKPLHRGRSWKEKESIPRAICWRATCDGCNALFKLAKKVTTKSPKERKRGTPQQAEIESAQRLWIKEDQRSLTDLKDHYADLTPFLQGGIDRDGRRLRRSSLVYHQVHPILSLSSNHISALINESSSLRVFHTGWENTLTKSRRRYWIVCGLGLAKKLVRDCTCRKLQQRPHINRTANRPPERMKLFSPPFQ